MSISDHEVAQEYFSSSVALANRSGYVVALDFAMTGWAELMRSAPSTTIVNPTFDPSSSDLLPGQAFWISVTDREGIVACIADRLFVTDNFMDEIGSGRLWYRNPTPEQSVALLPGAANLEFGGRVGHAGGLWIHPRVRKAGLSWILPRMARAISIMNWDVDRHCGMVFDDLYRSGMTSHSYGFPEGHHCIEGYFPPAGKHSTVHVVHICRDDIIAQFADDIAVIRDRGDHHMRDIAKIVGKREHEAAVRAAVV